MALQTLERVEEEVQTGPRVRCINQVFRPKDFVQVLGCGNCEKYIPHPDNKYCLAYSPLRVGIHYFEVVEGSD